MIDFTDEERAALVMLLAAGVCNIGTQIAQGGFAVIEDGRAALLLNTAVALRAKLKAAKEPE